MNDAIVTEMVGGEPYEYVPLGDHVVRAIGVCRGRPTFKYTRIEIAGVLDRVADGESLDEIARGFDSYVSREAIAEAVTIANRLFTASYPAFPSLAVQKIAA